MKNGSTAASPNNTKNRATENGILLLHKTLNPEALIYPNLTNESLPSIGQLFDKGCIAIFDKYKLYISRDGKEILSGDRNLKDGLWDVPFQSNLIQSINCIIPKDKIKQS